jgi:hypothetical protein
LILSLHSEETLLDKHIARTNVWWTDWLIDIMLHMFFGTLPITFPMSSCTAVTAHLSYILLDSGTHVKMLWIPAWDLLKWWYLQNKRWRWKTKCIISIPKTITNVKSVVSGTGNLWGRGYPIHVHLPINRRKKDNWYIPLLIPCLFST